MPSALARLTDAGCTGLGLGKRAGTCTETATTSVAEDKTACDGVTGAALDTATACDALLTKASDDTQDDDGSVTDVKACTYGGFYQDYATGRVPKPQKSVCLDQTCRVPQNCVPGCVWQCGFGKYTMTGFGDCIDCPAGQYTTEYEMFGSGAAFCSMLLSLPLPRLVLRV